MNAYGKDNLYNKYVQDQSESAFENGLLSEASFNNIKTLHPFQLYTPNYFIRIGLALLSAIAILFISVLVGLVTGIASDGGFITLLLLLAAICYTFLEVFISSNKYYNAGIDNTLMLAIIIFIIIACNINNFPWQYQVTSVIVGALCLWLAIRFTDSLMSAFCYVAIVSFWFFSCANAGDLGKAVAPFAIFIVSAIIFVLVSNLHSKEQMLLYRRCLQVVRLLTLISFYASVNYFIVRELSSLMFAGQLQPGEPIPFGWFFWLCTAFIPPAYLLYGVRKKDIMFIRTGFALAVVSVLTLTYYYDILPASTLMALFGVLLIAGSYFLIKHLRTAKRGFTSLNIYKTTKAIPDIEALVITQAFGSKVVHHQEGIEFGGGSSGGAGATGKFD